MCPQGKRRRSQLKWIPDGAKERVHWLSRQLSLCLSAYALLSCDINLTAVVTGWINRKTKWEPDFSISMLVLVTRLGSTRGWTGEDVTLCTLTRRKSHSFRVFAGVYMYRPNVWRGGQFCKYFLWVHRKGHSSSLFGTILQDQSTNCSISLRLLTVFHHSAKYVFITSLHFVRAEHGGKVEQCISVQMWPNL